MSSQCQFFIINTASQREADAGVLEKVELFDFMCHKHLELNLSPNVNFILGRNGSKSQCNFTHHFCSGSYQCLRS